MKILIAVGILIFSNFAQAEDIAVAAIRKEYQLIQQASPTLKTEEVDLEDYAVEGAGAKAYRDKQGILRVIKADFFHESGKEFKEFYYKDGILIFAFYITHRYNQHPGITPEIAKQEGIEEGFDPKKTVTAEDRYYFSNSKMIRWIDENHKEVNPNSKEYRDSEQDIMETSIDMLSKFEKHATTSTKGKR
jgi:hypothetical protein